MKDTVIVRRGGPNDLAPALAVWRAAEETRRGGQPVSPEHGGCVRAHMQNRDAFLFVAESDAEVVGMAVGMQGLAADGAGPPIEGLCHVGAVFVAPDRWERASADDWWGRCSTRRAPGATAARSSGRKRTTDAPTGSTNVAAFAGPAARRTTTSGRPSSTMNAASSHMQRAKRRDDSANNPVGAGFEPARRTGAGQMVGMFTMRRHG